jgi:hypothetical protein
MNDNLTSRERASIALGFNSGYFDQLRTTNTELYNFYYELDKYSIENGYRISIANYKNMLDELREIYSDVKKSKRFTLKIFLCKENEGKYLNDNAYLKQLTKILHSNKAVRYRLQHYRLLENVLNAINPIKHIIKEY